MAAAAPPAVSWLQQQYVVSSQWVALLLSESARVPHRGPVCVGVASRLVKSLACVFSGVRLSWLPLQNEGPLFCCTCSFPCLHLCWQFQTLMTQTSCLAAHGLCCVGHWLERYAGLGRCCGVCLTDGCRASMGVCGPVACTPSGVVWERPFCMCPGHSHVVVAAIGSPVSWCSVP